MTNGPDVTELEANLIALGYAHGLFCGGERSLQLADGGGRQSLADRERLRLERSSATW